MELKELHNRELSKEEVEYIKLAINAGAQSTEILLVLTLNRLLKHSLREVVGAMEEKDHKVLHVYPMDIQKTITMMKIGIQQVHRASGGLVNAQGKIIVTDK